MRGNFLKLKGFIKLLAQTVTYLSTCFQDATVGNRVSDLTPVANADCEVRKRK